MNPLPAGLVLPICSQNRTPGTQKARPSSGAGLLTCYFLRVSDGIRTHDTQDHKHHLKPTVNDQLEPRCASG